ncbi:hypothetical protein BGZ92_009835 [Podila epicladia]|nr:hypothetical protein BGZ92_009835 [Podila epicladia]
MRLAFKVSSLALALVSTLVAARLEKVTDADYQSKVLNSAKHVLVEFVQEDCDSCDIVEDRLEEIASKYSAKLSIFKIDTTNKAESQVSPSQFNIQGYPALVLFFNTAFVAGLSGNQSKDQIKTFLDSNLH